MKKYILLLPVTVLFFAFVQQEPIKKEQLLQPQELAYMINNPKAVKPVILNLGPVDQIKGAIKAGSVNDDDGFKKFKAEVNKIDDKNKTVVVYCGCCTLDNCPNIRPAVKYLTDNGFKKAKVLNIPTGIKEDWVQKGFPMEK
ncbi:MAG: rhodanese-like domain-containing protein [Bacteroidetes bacterium]|nr:rhodanese-like domain-containing protein [Bacteroidota bacterium]